MTKANPIHGSDSAEPRSRIPQGRQINFVVPGALILLIFATFWQVSGFDFINFDDPAYVVDNEQVKAGVSIAGLKWALTATQASNWHPVTWLSLMLDLSLFGQEPGLLHLSNLFLHALNSLLLFFLCTGVTKNIWQSAFLAALFALHPLHVESVAWISERKDLLSTFFMLLSILAYGRYVRRGKLLPYLAALALFVLGLLAKPMVVTLPFLLLLLDYWPFCRLGSGDGVIRHGEHISLLDALLEKIPFGVLAVAVAIITVVVQGQSGAIKSLAAIPVMARIDNALVSYVSYLQKMVWPVDLAILYPHPRTIPGGEVGVAIVVLLGISVSVFRAAPRYRFLATGWLWYLLSLLPVIGLVQVGTQAMADRYTYIPSIGILVMVVYGLPLWWARWPLNRQALGALLLVVVGGVSAATYRQLQYWQNSETVFRHALAVTEGNFVAHNYLGSFLATQNKAEDAAGHYRAALEIFPDYVEALDNLGVLLAKENKNQEAKVLLTRAMSRSPGDPKLYNNLGNVFKNEGKYDEASHRYQQAMDLDPTYAEAVTNLANIQEKLGNLAEAEVLYLKALQLKPSLVESHNGLGVVCARAGRQEKAIAYFKQALQLKPDYRPAQENLSRAVAQLNNLKR